MHTSIDHCPHGYYGDCVSQPDPPSGSSPASGRPRQFTNRPTIKPIALLVPILGLLVALAAWLKPDPLGLSEPTTDKGAPVEASQAGSTNTQRPATSVLGPSPSAHSSPRTNVRVGDCLSGVSITSCDAPYQFQVMSLGTQCTVGDAIKFLGGDLRHDVLIEAPTSRHDPEGQGASSCILAIPAEVSPPRSLAGILPTRTGDSLRRCFDATINQNVPCDELHTAEYVALTAGVPSSLNACISAAGDYLGSPLSANADSLTVQVVAPQRDTDRRLCLIESIGDRGLRSSLRSIKYRSIRWAN